MGVQAGWRSRANQNRRGDNLDEKPGPIRFFVFLVPEVYLSIGGYSFSSDKVICPFN